LVWCFPRHVSVSCRDHVGIAPAPESRHLEIITPVVSTGSIILAIRRVCDTLTVFFGRRGVMLMLKLLKWAVAALFLAVVFCAACDQKLCQVLFLCVVEGLCGGMGYALVTAHC